MRLRTWCATRFVTRAEGTAVEVALRKQNGGSDNFAVISVRDRGNGVPEEALEKIFRPFYRTEDARDRQSGGGTGFGPRDHRARSAHAWRLGAGGKCRGRWFVS